MPEAGVGVSLGHRVQHALRVRVIYIPVGDTAVNAAVLLHIGPCRRVNLLNLYVDACCLCLLLECGCDCYVALIFGVYGYAKVNAIRISCLSKKGFCLLRIILKLWKAVIMTDDTSRDVGIRNGCGTVKDALADGLTVDGKSDCLSYLRIGIGLAVYVQAVASGRLEARHPDLSDPGCWSIPGR